MNETAAQSQTVEETLPIRPQVTSEFMKWIITGEDVADNIEVELTGRKLYNGKLMVVNPLKERLINDKGINSIKIIVTSNIGKGSVASNLDEDEIRWILNDIRRDLDDKLYISFDEWEVKETDCSTIRAVVENNVLYAIKRAKEGREIELWSKGMKRTEIGNSPNKEKGGGFFGWLGLK